MRFHRRYEGEEALDGINIGGSLKTNYVVIRHGMHLLWIRIPVANPKDYEIDYLIGDAFEEPIWDLKHSRFKRNAYL